MGRDLVGREALEMSSKHAKNYQKFVDKLIPQSKRGLLENEVEEHHQLEIAADIVNWEVNLVGPLGTTGSEIKTFKSNHTEEELRKLEAMNEVSQL